MRLGEFSPEICEMKLESNFALDLTGDTVKSCPFALTESCEKLLSTAATSALPSCKIESNRPTTSERGWGCRQSSTRISCHASGRFRRNVKRNKVANPDFSSSCTPSLRL